MAQLVAADLLDLDLSTTAPEVAGTDETSVADKTSTSDPSPAGAYLRYFGLPGGVTLPTVSLQLTKFACNWCSASQVANISRCLSAHSASHLELILFYIEVTSDIVEPVKPKTKKEKADATPEPVAPTTAAAAEPMPDLIGSTDNLMCVTIGGQSIVINTKPSMEPLADEDSAENSPEGSPIQTKCSSSSKKTVDDPTPEVASADKSMEGAVMDLLADFSSPTEVQGAVSESEAAGEMNSDIMDLLGGLGETAPVACPPLQGSIGKVTVVG